MKSINIETLQTWDIVVAHEAIPSEQYAAEEFQRLFREATGKTLSIHHEIPQTGNHIFIGPDMLPPGDAPSVDLGEEGLHLVIDTDRIVITGGRPRGTLYGVYQFFEDYLGVRFLTYDHTHIPDVSSVEIPCGIKTYIPPFAFRWSAYYENDRDLAFATRLRVNTLTDDERLGGRTSQPLIGHSFHWLVPYEEYGATHPEYFALVDGKRDTIREANQNMGGPQICVTNPEVIEVSANKAIERLNENSDITTISISQADTEDYCRCEACEAINTREGTPMGTQLAFVNAVAERIEKVHPRVKVGTLSYWYTRKPPKTLRPRHNVQIQFCSIEGCMLHTLDEETCPLNREIHQDLEGWRAICDDIWMWHYNVNFYWYDVPFPNFRSIGPNVRYFRDKGLKGVYMQGNINCVAGEMSDLRNYLMSRMLWNPDLDGAALCEEFIQLHYAEAAGPIRDHIRRIHEDAEAKGLHPECFPKKPEDNGLDAALARASKDAFSVAMRLAASDTVRQRVEKVSICGYRSMIVAGDMTDEERDATIDRYIELVRKHKMTQSAHMGKIIMVEEYIKTLRD